jgi:hypothetical protein
MSNKKTHLHLLSVLSVTLFLFTGCQKEINDPSGGGTTTGGVNDNIMVTGGIAGIVIDENNFPVMGATVTSGGHTTTTDRYGAFRFSNISISKANGTVKVTVPGYFNAYRTFPATAGRTHNVRIKLIPKINSGNFSAISGGTVNITGGVKLVVPANAISNSSGTSYTGQVNVTMTWIDPSSDDLPYTVMGDLRGLTTANEEMGLSTYGMIGVELTDAGGQSLKIATGKTAELTFPVPASLQGNAPATIDLWHFDETTARWKQEGTATKTGSNYIANVSHFSFWNCDAPFPLIDLCMSFKDPSGNPLINAQVRIKRVVNNTYGYGRTDSAGNLCGKVPKNEALVLEVLDLCNTVAYSQNIGPFSSNTTLPPITVNMPATNSLIITGTVTNCSGGNVTNGAAIIYVSGGNHYTVPVTNGAFTLSIVRCTGAAINFSVLGIDYAAQQQGTPVGGSGTSGIVNVGTVQACGTSTVQFAEYLIDGTVYNFTSPPAQFFSNDSTGSWGTYTNKTTFYGTLQGGGVTTGACSLAFPNSQAIGTYPIHSGFMQYTASVQAMQFVSPNPVVTITAFGASPGGFIVGNYNEIMNVSGTPKMVHCNFRVRRN